MNLRLLFTRRASWPLAALATFALAGIACQPNAPSGAGGGAAQAGQSADSHKATADDQGDKKADTTKAETPKADAAPKDTKASGEDSKDIKEETPPSPPKGDAERSDKAPNAAPKAPSAAPPSQGKLAIKADKLRRATPVRSRPVLKDIPLQAMGKGGTVTLKWIFERQGKRAGAQPDEPERVRVILRLERGDWSREIDTGVTQAGCRATPASRVKGDHVMAASCFWAGQGFKLTVRRVKRLIVLERTLLEDGKKAKERDPDEVARVTLPPGASVLLARPETIDKRP